MSQDYEEAAKRIQETANAVAVTGAGVSVESGLPDFRSESGIWQKYPPEEFATIWAFEENPERLWEMWFELGKMMIDIGPNPGHQALAELEELGHLKAVITQNIDSLHQDAGSSKVIEYHGNARRLKCLNCHKSRPLTDDVLTGGPPQCDCGTIMKPDVVLFGEMIPTHAVFESEALAQKCEVMIVVGTSAQVYPAAAIPFTAKSRGAFIIECNTEPTEFTKEITDIFLEGPSGETLPRLVNWVRR